MAYLGLPAALKARGLTVETVPGWETRSAGSLVAKGAVCHWTAGPRNSTTRPSLSIVTNGRPDLSGPLANVYLDRRGVAVVIAAGRANHAGAGNWRGLTMNSQLFGTEAEAADSTDFTDAQRWAYPRVNAAYCDLGKFGAEMVCGHSEFALPAGRKSDINQYPMTTMRAQVAAILAGEDDMPLTDDDITRVWAFMVNGVQARDRLQGIDTVAQQIATRQVGYGNRIEDTQAKVSALQSTPAAKVNVDAAAVAAALAADPGFLAGLAKAVNDDAARRLAS